MRNVSKTKIKKHERKKTNPSLKETILFAMKQKNWLPLAKRLAGATRRYASVNLSEIEKQTTLGDTVLVAGKVLSQGEMSKKIRIAALGFSTAAREKLKKTKSEAVTILQEIKENPKAEGLKVIG